MPTTTYTITTGGQTKLLATTDGTTRTVTTLTGLGVEDARDLATHLGKVDRDLTLWTADPDAFAGQARKLGLRTDQVFSGSVLHASALAQAPVPAEVTYGPDTFAVHAVAVVLRLLGRLPDAAARAVRSELADIVAVYDGPVAVAVVDDLDGQVRLNVARWVAEAPDQTVGDLLIGSWPDNQQAAEDIAWFYSRPGAATENLAHGVVAAEADLGVTVGLTEVAARLATTRGELTDALVAESIDGDYDLSDEQTEAVTKAAELSASC